MFWCMPSCAEVAPSLPRSVSPPSFLDFLFNLLLFLFWRPPPLSNSLIVIVSGRSKTFLLEPVYLYEDMRSRLISPILLMPTRSPAFKYSLSMLSRLLRIEDRDLALAPPSSILYRHSLTISSRLSWYLGSRLINCSMNWAALLLRKATLIVYRTAS